MAEIRKHNPKRDEISDAINQYLGEPIRPVEPGSYRDRPDNYDPFDSGELVSKPVKDTELGWLGGEQFSDFEITE
uniref:hypothetical protein n=1 Tax=Vaginimicrobium propionicum TaxID=1871034 RepID=UPI00097145CA|nr:hypothetical protein [Vaginimicrobium propionicum]